MNKMNQFLKQEVFGGQSENPICHLLSDKLGLGVGVLWREGK
jgi:hypothetical protein